MATPQESEVKDTGVPTNDAYTGMLIISLLALIVGSVLLYLDYTQYPTSPPANKGLPPPPELKKPGAVEPKLAPPEVKKDGDAVPLPGKDMPPPKDAPPPKGG
jgi:hypothetical protein